jgi:glycosyltransferase involved in cell wall biosynthesis
VHPVKGLPNLLRAWTRQAANFPDWTLRLVGPDHFGHKDELRRIIEELKVPRVSIEDPAFGDDKTQLMANAGLFVLPSLAENFAMTVAESLAFGVPVISSKGAPWSGLAHNRCGWWVDGTIEGLSSALGAALSLPASERQKMGQRGHEWMARDFGWEGIGRRMGAVYDWVLGKGDVTDDIIFV